MWAWVICVVEDVLSFRNEKVCCASCQDEEFQDVDGCYNDMGQLLMQLFLFSLVI